MTNKTTAANLREIYEQAFDIDDAAEREAFLQKACGDDTSVRQRVEQLLAIGLPNAQQILNNAASAVAEIDTGETNLSNPEAMGIAETDDEPIRGLIDVSQHPMIGHYKLLEELGHGGMGSVYMAQQSQPVKRKVALKVIKPGMDTKEVIARFEAERQALAMMDHTNIAKVLDGGTTDEGRPYFVMELVRGVPITDYCKHKKLNLRKRLELFVDICKAVQHAHQKGVIHRDLKPSNIMITLHDGVPVVKVIDFGVAKALNQELTERTLYTQYSQMVGTPLYMAPEQAEMSGLDIDTRSDIYSLGVILYELLTETTPFDKATMSSLGVDGIRKLIKEQEPQRPSARVSTMKVASVPTIDDERTLDAEDVAKQLKRELDWIVMKALEKDRERRYESANAFAADVQRYLNDEPVEACPPTLSYRLKKYARKHKAWLTTATLLVAMLLTSTAVSGVFAYQANQSRLASEKSEQDAKDAQANAESEKAKAIAAQLQSDANLKAALGAIDKLLEHSTNGSLGSLPQVQAVQFNMISEALKLYEQFDRSHSADSAVRHRAAQTRIKKVFLEKELAGTGGYEEDEIRKALQDIQQLVAEDEGNSEYLRSLAGVRLFLGESLGSQGQFDDGMEQFEQALQICDELIEQFGANEDRERKAHLLHNQFIVKSQRGDDFDRIAHMERILETLQELPDEGDLHFTYTSAHRVIGKLTRDTDLESATEHIEKAITSKRKQVQAGVGGRVTLEQLGIVLNDTTSFFAPHDLDRAIQQSDEAVQLFATMVRDYPNLKSLKSRLAIASSVRLRLLLKDRTPEQKLDLLKDLERDFPNESLTEEFHQKVAAHVADLSNMPETFSTFVDKYPEMAAYYRYRGAAYRERGDLEKALADANRSIELANDTNRFDLLFSRALTHVAKGDDHAAIEDYTQILEVERPDWDDIQRRGACYFRIGEYEKAFADLREGMNRLPSDVFKLFDVPPGDVVSCENETYRQQYLNLVDDVVDQNEKSTESLLARAAIKVVFRDFAQASDDLKIAIERGDGNYYSHYQAALLALILGESNSFRAICEQMLDAPFASLENENGKETHFTAWTCALAPDALDTYDPAIAFARHAVEKSPQNQQYLDGLGAILMRAGKHDEAKEQLEKALDAGKDDNTSPSYIHYFLAMTEHHLGDTDAAKEHLTKANESAEKEFAGSPVWNRKLTLELLRKEAEALISSEKINDQSKDDDNPKNN